MSSVNFMNLGCIL